MRPETFSIVVLALAFAGIGSLPVTAEAPDQPAPGEARRVADRLLAELKQGRFADAVIESQAAVKRNPTSSLLRRRSAQASIAEAIVLSSQFQTYVQDASFKEMIPWVRETLSLPPQSNPKLNARQREQNEQLTRTFIDAISGAELKRFEDRVVAQLAASKPLLDRRSAALARAESELDEARRLGDTSLDYELSSLWLGYLRVAWIGQFDEAFRAFQGERDIPAELLEGRRILLKVGTGPNPKALSQSAAALANSHAGDPEALAGAADVMTAVGWNLIHAPDPLNSSIMAKLNRRYLKRVKGEDPVESPQALEALKHLYLQARDAESVKADDAPLAAAVSLYERALGKDVTWRFPLLRLRVYPIRAIGAPETAAPLLEELAKRQPQNAAVTMERARRALYIDDDPVSSLRLCRQVLQTREFNRTFLVAVPLALRTSFKYQAGLRELGSRQWPGFECLLGALEDAERAQPKIQAQIELILLRLQIADRMCGAPDWSDQAVGIEQRAQDLAKLSSIPGLTDEQRALVRTLAEKHAREFKDFPQSRYGLRLTPDGVEYAQRPSSSPTGFFRSVPQLLMQPPRGWVIVPPGKAY